MSKQQQTELPSFYPNRKESDGVPYKPLATMSNGNLTSRITATKNGAVTNLLLNGTDHHSFTANGTNKLLFV